MRVVFNSLDVRLLRSDSSITGYRKIESGTWVEGEHKVGLGREVLKVS